MNTSLHTRLKDYLAGQLAIQKDQYTILRVEPPKTTRKHKALPYRVQVVRMLVEGPKGLLWVEALYPTDPTEAMESSGRMPLVATARRFRGSISTFSYSVYTAPGEYPVFWTSLAELLNKVNQ